MTLGANTPPYFVLLYWTIVQYKGPSLLHVATQFRIDCYITWKLWKKIKAIYIFIINIMIFLMLPHHVTEWLTLYSEMCNHMAQRGHIIYIACIYIYTLYLV